jgi:LysR family positive regulator for ilvC
MLENLAVVLIAPALPCPVRNQVTWSARLVDGAVYHGRSGPVRRRIELWFRRHKISNPSIYATVGGHEAMVSMVALGCGVALLPEVVLENSPEPVRNRVMILERSDEQTPFELGVCAQKSGCMSRLLMLSGKFCQPLAREEKAERRVMGFVVALIAQLIETGFKVRLVLAQLEAASTDHSRCRGCGSGTAKYSSGCQGCRNFSSAPAIPGTRS